MNTEIIIAIISASGVVIASLIAAWATISNGIHKLDLKIITLEGKIDRVEEKLDTIILSLIDVDTTVKKVDKNVKFTKIINNKVKNIDKRVLELESKDVKNLISENKPTNKDIAKRKFDKRGR